MSAAAALAYAKLRDAEEVNPLNSSDTACIDEIRAVLEKYDRIDRFGVCLLHKHFQMQDDEMLVETTDVANRKLVMEVRKRAEAEAAGGFIETQWHLGASGAQMGCRVACVKAGGSDSHFPQHVWTGR
jgi:hypothetical protein